jgi:hypothetical protein
MDLPLSESAKLRDQLIAEAHEAILHEFDVRGRLGSIALDPARNQATPLTKENIQDAIKAMAPPAKAANRPTQTKLMTLWGTLLPGEPNRVALLRSLSRGTTITGRMLDGIAAGSQLGAPGKWLTTAGRALWGLVEISVPRGIGTLLGRYWQALLLMISIIMIFAGDPSVRCQGRRHQG